MFAQSNGLGFGFARVAAARAKRETDGTSMSGRSWGGWRVRETSRCVLRAFDLELWRNYTVEPRRSGGDFSV